MANKVNGEVAVTIGDRNYKLRLGIAQIIGIEAKLGASIMVIGARLGENLPRVGDMAAIFAAGLEGGKNGLSADEIEATTMAALQSGDVAKVGDLLAATFPAETSGDKDKAAGE